MPKPILPNDTFSELLFPSFGIDNSLSQYDGKRTGTTQLAANVRTYESITQRGRGGSRSGLTRYPNAKVGGLTTQIQHLTTMVTVSGDALGSEFYNPAAERFYDGDPSVPSEDGWFYTGDADYPLNTDITYIIDPSTNAPNGPPRNQGDPVPVEGDLKQKPKSKKKFRPLIQWFAQTDIYYPTPISGVQLTARALHPVTKELVAGTYVYKPPKGFVHQVGNTRPLRVVFTPDDKIKYWPTKGANSVNVLAYVYPTYTYQGYNWPSVLTVYYEWGPYSWATPATGVQGGGGDITWTIQGLPYTLVNLDDTNPLSQMVILNTASFNMITLTGGATFAFDTYLSVQCGHDGAPLLFNGSFQRLSTAFDQPPPAEPYTKNPLLYYASIAPSGGTFNLTKPDGTYMSYPLLMKVTGPPV